MIGMFCCRLLARLMQSCSPTQTALIWGPCLMQLASWWVSLVVPCERKIDTAPAPPCSIDSWGGVSCCERKPLFLAMALCSIWPWVTQNCNNWHQHIFICKPSQLRSVQRFSAGSLLSDLCDSARLQDGSDVSLRCLPGWYRRLTLHVLQNDERNSCTTSLVMLLIMIT